MTAVMKMISVIVIMTAKMSVVTIVGDACDG